MNIKRLKSHASGRLVGTWYEDKPCLAFAPHPLPPNISLDDKDLFLATSDAHGALGELGGLGRTIPNPQLLIRPFVRREAVLSSRIEGTQTGMEDLYAYEAGQLHLPGLGTAPPVADVHEVVNYISALEYGLVEQEKRAIDLDLIKDIHRLLMKGVRGERARPGQFRISQNWIGGTNIKSATFVPPPVSEMNEALNALEKYINSTHELPPLVRLALIHYQFEAIHPFVDGNGRTGRLLISLLLVRWKLLPLPLLYLSEFFEKRYQDYYDLLLAVTERGMWREWILFFLQGVAEQARDAIKRAKELQDLQLDWYTRLKDIRASSTLLGLADRLFDSPFITIPQAQAVLGVRTYNTARSGIQKLVAARILEPVGNEQYGKVFLAREIFDLFSEKRN